MGQAGSAHRPRRPGRCWQRLLLLPSGGDLPRRGALRVRPVLYRGRRRGGRDVFLRDARRDAHGPIRGAQPGRPLPAARVREWRLLRRPAGVHNLAPRRISREHCTQHMGARRRVVRRGDRDSPASRQRGAGGRVSRDIHRPSHERDPPETDRILGARRSLPDVHCLPLAPHRLDHWVDADRDRSADRRKGSKGLPHGGCR
mmetsp:Transcript_17586/g.42360  ORF Transcript_17586/g.42360 Transcript_17586/m.42360 type:complete len:201 (-) Transcript_17586:1048-1650(-)